MQKACGCRQRTWIMFVFAVVLGALLCGRDVAKAQDSPTPQQSPTAEESATPTTQTSSALATPPGDIRTGTVCDLPKYFI